jgi:hypothetical protein
LKLLFMAGELMPDDRQTREIASIVVTSGYVFTGRRSSGIAEIRGMWGEVAPSEAA